MSEITIYEGDDSKADYILSYGKKWSDPAKEGTPVLRTDVTNIFFYVKTKLSDSSPWLSLSDGTPGEIDWLDDLNGQIRVTFGRTTAGEAGDNQHYELRIKFVDGSYLTAESGAFNVLESVVDEP